MTRLLDPNTNTIVNYSKFLYKNEKIKLIRKYQDVVVIHVIRVEESTTTDSYRKSWSSHNDWLTKTVI